MLAWHNVIHSNLTKEPHEEIKSLLFAKMPYEKLFRRSFSQKKTHQVVFIQ